MEDIKELSENVQSIEAATPKKSKKRAGKVVAADELKMINPVTQNELPDLDYHIGDPIDFMIVDGKVIIGVV